jgi:hypothetical protein
VEIAVVQVAPPVVGTLFDKANMAVVPVGTLPVPGMVVGTLFDYVDMAVAPVGIPAPDMVDTLFDQAYIAVDSLVPDFVMDTLGLDSIALD